MNTTTFETLCGATAVLDSVGARQPYTVVIHPTIERYMAATAVGALVRRWPRRAGIRARKRAVARLCWTRRLPRVIDGVNVMVW